MCIRIHGPDVAQTFVAWILFTFLILHANDV